VAQGTTLLIMFEELKEELRQKNTVHFYVRARPGADNTGATEKMDDGSVKINLSAPAQAGKANAALISYLSKEFAVNAAHIEIVSGATARMKLIKITLT